MDNADILRRRLRHQGITGAGFRGPAAVVQAFGAMQAQEFAMACWAVGLRSSGSNERAVLAAFDAGEILRTHVLRPTWHFVAAADLRWILALSAPRVHALNAYQYRQLGLDAPRLRRAADVITRTLADNQPLTRTDLQTALARARLKFAGPALAYAIMYAELEGLICSGPRLGRQFSYALIESRTPSAKQLSREEALVLLARKFFATRGPATIHDFAYWSSFTVRDAREAASGLGEDFDTETIGGRTLIFPRRLPSARQNASATFLLPDYDEYGMSYRDRSALPHPAANPAVSLAFNRMIVVNGHVAGSWRRTFRGARVHLEMKLSVPLSSRERSALDEAIARYTRFIDRPQVS